MNIMKRISSMKRGILLTLFLFLSALTMCWGQLIEDLGIYSGEGMSNMACFTIDELNAARQRVNLYFTLADKRSAGLFIPGKDINICKQTLCGLVDGEEVEYPDIPIRQFLYSEYLYPVSYLPAGRYVLKIKVDTSRLPQNETNFCMFYFSKPLWDDTVVDVPLCLYLSRDSEPSYGNDPVGGITSSRSYVLTRQMLSDTGASFQERVAYFDGLGRQVQTVLKGCTPGGFDFADFTDYDSRGNVWRQWRSVPVEGFNGAFINNLPLKSSALCNESRPYSENAYVVSRPDSPARSIGLGESWKNHPCYSFRRSNSSKYPFDCAHFTVSPQGLPVRLGHWEDGELSVIRQTDEDGNERLTFTDKLGRVLLDRQLCDSVKHDTYYVYDRSGDLRCILPPALDSEDVTDEQFQKFGYAYTYDGLHRMIGKRLPGCGWQSFVYDAADRLIFSRDARQATRGEYTFSIPDGKGREVVRGVCSGSSSSLRSPSGVVKAVFFRRRCRRRYV
ncbi:DUF6443 domain-containing protein [Bacteroides pyogenes]|uniref:DUF6443 domain-containing protein n=1 Tax=Bacteroides pyogenes TaxID=310300 RepID=UPI001F413B87|nr:DUF6443 domain-containing protein [Bacteroides pyogenes]MCF2709617.1 hypothetical protein [Bacteroides pyogenes]